MDDTDTNQEASPQSSTEETPRQIDLRAIGSPTFAPLSPGVGPRDVFKLQTR